MSPGTYSAHNHPEEQRPTPVSQRWKDMIYALSRYEHRMNVRERDFLRTMRKAVKLNWAISAPRKVWLNTLAERYLDAKLGKSDIGIVRKFGRMTVIRKENGWQAIVNRLHVGRQMTTQEAEVIGSWLIDALPDLGVIVEGEILPYNTEKEKGDFDA